MALLPVSGTRTSTPLQQQRLLFQLNSDQLAIQRNFDQLSTGRRVLKLSDDPAAANRAITLQRSIDFNDQLVRNAVSTENFYAATDDILDRIDRALIEARGATTEGVTNTLSQDEREAHATTIRQTLLQVLAAANTSFRDHQLSSGALEREPGFVSEGSTVLFRGTDTTSQVRVGTGDPVTTGIPVRDTLATTEPIAIGNPLDAGINPSTRLVDLRNGLGVPSGVIRISDGGQFQDVDLSIAATIGDVQEIINSVDLNGRQLSLTIQNDGVTLDYADALPGTLAVSDVVGGSTAADLYLLNENGFDPPPLVSTGLAPRVTLSTDLSDLNGGAGIDVSDGIQIARDDQVVNIDLSAATTVGDVIIAINRSDANVRAQLSENTNQLELIGLRSGVDYSIGENGGTAATDLGIRSADGSTALTSLDKGRGLLLSGGAPELTISRPDGTDLDIELSGLSTVDDVVNAINTHVLNTGPGAVTASVTSFGNGVDLEAPVGTQPLSIQQSPDSDAGVRLGLIPTGQTQTVGQTVAGVETIQGSDFALLEAKGTVDTLLRLEQAIRDGDTVEIGRLQGDLEIDLDRSIQARGRLGVWTQNLAIERRTAESQSIALKDLLSTEVDADFAEVISNLNLRQTALEASLRLIGQTSQLSVLDFL